MVMWQIPHVTLCYPSVSGFCKVFWGPLIICKLLLVGHGTEFVNFVQLYFGEGNTME